MSVIPESEYSIITNQDQRSVIRRRTAELVEQVVGNETDTVVFLDKTARPLVTAFIHQWQSCHPDLPLPQIRFLRIGREKATAIHQWMQDNFPNQNKPDIEDILSRENLEKIFGQENIQFIEHALGKARSVLVVDDFRCSGKTARIATTTLSSLFPGLIVDTFFVISSQEDKKPFYGDFGARFLPWDTMPWNDKSISGVEDPLLENGGKDQNSFTSSPLSKKPGNDSFIANFRQLRRELRSAVNEGVLS